MHKRNSHPTPGRLLALLLLTSAGAASAADYSGSLRGNAQTLLSAQVSGEVVAVQARAGERVQAGKVLARLDARTAQARVRDAAARAEDAKRQLERMRILYERGVIADRDLEVAQRDYDQSQAQWQAAQVDLALTEIRAPFSGRVQRSYVSTGQTVVARLNAPRLFLLAPDGRSLRLSVEVPAGPALRVGDKLPVRAGGRRFDAVLIQVQPVASRPDRQFLVLQVLHDGRSLRPGMQATVILPDAADQADGKKVEGKTEDAAAEQP
ncbi:MAG: efflux RND transporter periplasmic adaptor subunit [Pseudomonadota bacterium]|uniref:efflux RND transporter periplasmic adaptor subunit n=1 Tax=Thermithiobacillus tepidarius TaxID=929 RepID=UPI0003F991AA|nr:efflux RND transporter periplasmic adaptor subunit [Thermithiobacillus tepidarius]